ncbi:MAG: O-antigen ligase family protein [Candidatus Zixiibacteriota bacterium]
METEDKSAVLAGRPHGIESAAPIITGKVIGYAALILLSVAAAVTFLLLPGKFQPVMLFVFPAIVIGIWVLKNPWVGIYLFYLYNLLRPYDFIPALQPLRLAMVLEILTLISWVIYIIRSKTSIKWSIFNWGYLGFLGVMALGVAMAANNRMAYDTLEAMLITFIMFLIATNVVDSLDRLNKLVWLVLLINLYFAVQGTINREVLHVVVRGEAASGRVGSGYIADENDFALALVVWVPFAFFMFQYFRSIKLKLISVFILLVFLWGVVSSMSRGGMVALMAALLYCLLNSPNKARSLAMAFVVVLGFAAVAPGYYWHEMASMTQTEEGTAEERLLSWQAAGRMYLDYPVIGVGPGNGGIHFPRYIRGVSNPDRYWGRAFHGTLPQVLAEVGTVGFLFYAFMVVYAVKQLRRIKRKLPDTADSERVGFMANSLIGGLIAYFAGATFLSTIYYPHLWILYTFIMILLHVSSQRTLLEPSTPAQPALEKVG